MRYVRLHFASALQALPTFFKAELGALLHALQVGVLTQSKLCDLLHEFPQAALHAQPTQKRGEHSASVCKLVQERGKFEKLVHNLMEDSVNHHLVLALPYSTCMGVCSTGTRLQLCYCSKRCTSMLAEGLAALFLRPQQPADSHCLHLSMP